MIIYPTGFRKIRVFKEKCDNLTFFVFSLWWLKLNNVD